MNHERSKQLTDRERRAEELQRTREALDRMQDDDSNSGGEPLALSDWRQKIITMGVGQIEHFT